MRRTVAALAVLAAITIAACGSDNGTAESSTSVDSEAPAEAMAGGEFDEGEMEAPPETGGVARCPVEARS